MGAAFKAAALVAVASVLAGRAIQRAEIAGEAKKDMVGLSKEQVLACMGPPANKAAVGATEVWSYNSGNGLTQFATFDNNTMNASMYGSPRFATATGSSFGSGYGFASRRYCTVNVVMSDGRVSRVNYSGPTGGLLSAGEQCAYAVRNCVRAAPPQ